MTIPENSSGTAIERPAVYYLFRSFLAVLVGILLFTALASAFTRLAGVQVPPRPGGEKLLEAALCVAAAMLLTGYGVGRIAGRWELFVGAGVGVLMSVGAGRAHLEWQGLEPAIAPAVALVCFPVFAILGAWVAGRMSRGEARKRAAEILELPLVIRQRAIAVWFVCFLALGMAAAGVWVIKIGDSQRVGWSAALFFGAIGLVMFWRGITRRPQAIIRDEGVELPMFQAVIPWSEILDAAPHPLVPGAVVRLRVVDPQRYLNRLSPLQSAFTQVGEAEPNISIPLSGTPYTLEQICGLIRSRARGLAEQVLAR
jgi:hypothetical protein